MELLDMGRSDKVGVRWVLFGWEGEKGRVEYDFFMRMNSLIIRYKKVKLKAYQILCSLGCLSW